jgi:hypothetical protein
MFVQFYKIKPGTEQEPTLHILGFNKIGAILWIGRFEKIWFQWWSECPNNNLRQFYPSVFRKSEWLDEERKNVDSRYSTK